MSRQGTEEARGLEADLERRREAVRVVMRVGTLSAVVIALVSLVSGHKSDFLTGSGAAIYLGLLWWGSRHWRVEWVTMGATLGLTALALYAMAIGNGIHDVAIVGVPIAVLTAGYLLDLRHAVPVALAAIAGAAGVGVAEAVGIMKVNPTATHAEEIIVLSILLVAGGAVAAVAVRALDKALAQTRAAERNYREVFNATNEAIFVVDPSTQEVVDVNQTAVAMLGASREQILADGLLRLAGSPPYGLDDARRWVARSLDEGPQIFEWLLHAGEGRERWLEITLRRARIGGCDRLLAVARDIHERKLMEERLRQADRLQAVGQLAGGVAHDFNNQLTGILGFVELLQISPPTQRELDESLTGIRTAARRAADLTRQLLAFARKGKVREVSVDLHETVREVTALISRSIDKRIEIAQRLEASTACTLGDPSQLSSALLNLAINARDAMPAGGLLTFATDLVELRGDACHRPPFELAPGRYVRLRVADTGEGMAPSVRAHIFEPFFTTKESGAGMGLPAVYGTVTAHHGAVEVDSVPGRGTTFTLLLPLCDDGTAAERSQEPAALASRPAARIMVVDDEPLVLAVVMRALTRAGHRVKGFTSAEQALAEVRGSPAGWDAAVIDLNMPGMNGEQLLQELRHLVPGLAAVIVSGFASEDERRRGGGLARIVEKPFSTEQLLEALVAALAARPSVG